MQLHIGALRSINKTMTCKVGINSGFDIMEDNNIALGLCNLLDALNSEGHLPKTILYNLNPKDNYVIASIAGTFNEKGIRSKVQFGPAWWFCDQKKGMENHLEDLASLGLLGNFIGMVTDSRSMVSFARHEYFRRILCNKVGKWVEDGEYPNDSMKLEEIIKNICYKNALNYFGI